MTPEDMIAALDNGLTVDGEEIKLRRVVGTGNNQQFVDVEVTARVTGISAQELVGTTSENEFYCIFSPTGINAAAWPGAMPVLPTPSVDPRIPSKTRGDFAFVRGIWRAVLWAAGEYPLGTLVRVNMRVQG